MRVGVVYSGGMIFDLPPELGETPMVLPYVVITWGLFSYSRGCAGLSDVAEIWEIWVMEEVYNAEGPTGLEREINGGIEGLIVGFTNSASFATRNEMMGLMVLRETASYGRLKGREWDLGTR